MVKNIEVCFYVIIFLIIVYLLFFRKKEGFTISQPSTTPEQYLSAYKAAPPSTITNTTSVINPDDIPEVISTYYSGTTMPIRNRIYVIDISTFFNGKAYTSFSNLVKRWPSVTYTTTDKGIVYVKAPYPQGREQIIPFQNNRIIVMDTNTENLDSYTFECLNKAQAAFVRSLLIGDGAVLNTVVASENAQLWAQKAQAEASEDLANYNHGYNTGYSLGLANSCTNNVAGSGSGSSSSSFDIFSSATGYAKFETTVCGFGDSLLNGANMLLV
jgi:hypothetical protein